VEVTFKKLDIKLAINPRRTEFEKIERKYEKTAD